MGRRKKLGKRKGNVLFRIELGKKKKKKGTDWGKREKHLGVKKDSEIWYA